MKIEKIELENFRSAKKISIELNKQLSLFVGVNGAGKSTILDAVSICLSWLIKRIERADGQGMTIHDSSLTTGQKDGALTLHVRQHKKTWNWVILKMIRRTLYDAMDLESMRDGVDRLAESILKYNNQTAIWPVIAYYPVNRVVKNIQPIIPEQNTLFDLDIYKNALGGETNYQAFFEWFRNEDDIANEQRNSGSQWMRCNRSLVQLRVNKLINLLKDAWQAETNGNYSEEESSYLFEDFDNNKLYEDPYSLFISISWLLKDIFGNSELFSDYGDCFDHLQSISYAPNRVLTSYSREFNTLNHKISRFTVLFDRLRSQKKVNEKMIFFLWESFIYAVFLNLWEMSDKGKLLLENNLRALLSPPTADVSTKQSDEFTQHVKAVLTQSIEKEIKQENKSTREQRHELQVVINAIEQFLPEYHNLRITRIPRPKILIDKNGETFDLNQLSDGEKNLLVLVGDIARRFAIGNAQADNPLAGEGIILIDEIDLHLHPNWQRLVVPKLLEVFPNCQFLISTHSPQVITHVKPENVFLLEQTNTGELQYTKAEETYGMSLNRVVELVMNDESRPNSVQHDLDTLFELIEREKFSRAKQLVASLKKDMQSDPEILRAEMLIRRQEMTLQTS